jgi:hypothetical protein
MNRKIRKTRSQILENYQRDRKPSGKMLMAILLLLIAIAWGW